MNDNDLPVLKVKLSKFEIEEMRQKKKKRTRIIISILLIFVILGVSTYFGYGFLKGKKLFIFNNETKIVAIDVLSYDQSANTINVSLSLENEQKACAFSKNNSNSDNLDFIELRGNKCEIVVPFEKGYIYLKNKDGVVSEPQELNNYVVDFNVDDKYYLPLSNTGAILDKMVVVGEPTIEIEGNNDVIKVEDFKYNTNANGKTLLSIKNGELQKKDIEVVVTNTIVPMPKEYNKQKAYLACEQFTEEEATLLDEILAYRIAEAGYGTRAGVVAAARFLTLEFPYKISYYFENGRLNGTGTHLVDAEGRYYHQGLYLSKSKYATLLEGAHLQGPQMWGCKMKSYEDDRRNGYIPGGKYPNGLDCSGFVTWTMINGGFDVGDRGAGENAGSIYDMTDLGSFKRITNSMIKHDEIKVGDLFNFWGHIAILVGKDENNYYIAESLNTWKSVVVNKYAKDKVMNTFKYVVFMDSVYKEDGNLTNMWY